ncbi:unnamed protein product [Effrenium voratum]|nr:unnamed protein product [Effrenium voratum]
MEPPRCFKKLELDEKKWLKNYTEKVVAHFIKDKLPFMPRKGWIERKVLTKELWPPEAKLKDIVEILNWASLRAYGQRQRVWSERKGKDHDGAGIKEKLETEDREALLTTPSKLPFKEFERHVAVAFDPKKEQFQLRKGACDGAWPTRLSAKEFARLCNGAFEECAYGARFSSAFIAQGADIIMLADELKESLRRESASLCSLMSDFDKASSPLISSDPSQGSPTTPAPAATAAAAATAGQRLAGFACETASLPSDASSSRLEQSAEPRAKRPQTPQLNGQAARQEPRSDEAEQEAVPQGRPQTATPAAAATEGPRVEETAQQETARRWRGRSRSVSTTETVSWGTLSDGDASVAWEAVGAARGGMGWHRSRLRNMDFGPQIYMPSKVVQKWRGLAPEERSLTNFPRAINEPEIKNYLLHSVWHRVDRNLREEDVEEETPAMWWFGIDGPRQEVFLLILNSNMVSRHDFTARLLLVLVPNNRMGGSPSNPNQLLFAHLFPSSNLCSEPRMSSMLRNSLRELLPDFDLCCRDAICRLEESGVPLVPAAFETSRREDLTFDPRARVNVVGIAQHIRHEARSHRIPVEFSHLSDADINQRVQWAITRLRNSPHCAVPQYFTDRNCVRGGSINFLAPLSLSEPGSDDAAVALVLVPERSRTGERYYNAMTILSLMEAHLNALVVNPFSGHWLRIQF